MAERMDELAWLRDFLTTLIQRGRRPMSLREVRERYDKEFIGAGGLTRNALLARINKAIEQTGWLREAPGGYVVAVEFVALAIAARRAMNEELREQRDLLELIVN